jgi:glycerophosphoryl diester phosphodiesterase
MRAFLGFTGLLAALGSCRVASEDQAPARVVASPLVFAHRAGGGEAPEGTVAAVRAAMTLPGLGIEFDVRRTRDGHLIVLHDARVDRTTNGQGEVRALTLAEVQALDAGGGASIPTLAQMLAAVPPQVPVSIELKAPGFEEDFARQVRAWGHLDRLVVGSMDDAVASRLKRLLPEARHFFPRRAAACVVLAAKLGLTPWSCGGYDVLAIPRRAFGLDLTTEGFVRAVHARGLPIYYFTVNDPAEMERLLAGGADGLFTDYPRRARAVLDRLGRAAPP